MFIKQSPADKRNSKGEFRIVCCSLILYSIVCFTFIDANTLASSVNDFDDSESRIIGGQLANAGDFKGVVSIQTILNQYACVGTLIRQKLILTAAHCLIHDGENSIQPRIFRVIGDDLKISAATASAGRQVRGVIKIVIHPNYNFRSRQNDIALVTVDKPFVATNTFSPVKLTDVEPVNSEACAVAGWGYTNASVELLSDNLMMTSVSVIPMRECNGSLSHNGTVPNSAFCAGSVSGGKLCHGDSGAALLCNGVVKGIVSRYGCAIQTHAGVYTNVNQYKQWIQENSGRSITSSFAASTLIIVFFGISKIRGVLFT